MKIKLFLSLIVVVGAFLRLYNLSNSPPSLNWDEAALGYNAYSISLSGHDEYGKYFPIFTRSFDEYKSTLPLYLMIPTIQIFGLGELGVRLPSALFGIIGILVVYLLAKEIFKDEKVALVSAFAFSIEPWAVHLSRVYHEGNEAMVLFLLGFLLFLKSRSSPKLLPFSVVSFMLSMYTYNSSKILSPLFLGMTVYLNRKWLAELPKKVIRVSLVVLLVFAVPFLVLAFLGQAFARVSTTNIFMLWPTETGPKLFYFAWDLVGRFISYFSPYNLFLREPQEPSTIVAGNSMLHPFEFIPWAVGAVYLFKNYKKHKEFFALVLMAPLPAILTWNWFQPGRVMVLFASYSILTGIGLVKFVGSVPRILRGWAYVALVIFALFNVFYLFDSINVYLPLRDYGNWQPGFKETVPLVMKLSQDYDHVIIDTPNAQPYIFYLFYGKYDPEKYAGELDLAYIGTPRKHFDFGKFRFRKIDWFRDQKLEKTLLVGVDKYLEDVEVKRVPGAKMFEVKDRYGEVITKMVGLD